MKHWLKRDLITGPYFRLCLNRTDYLREVKRLDIYDPDEWVGANGDATTHSFRYKGQPVSIVCLDRTGSSDMQQIAGLLVHEAVHIWQNYCRYIGEHQPSDEFEAYSVQAIAQRLIASYIAQTTPAKKSRSKGKRARR